MARVLAIALLFLGAHAQQGKRHAGSPFEKENIALHKAVVAGSVPEIDKALAAKHADINFLHPITKQSTVMVASLAGHTDALKFLLEKGGDPLLRERDGMLPLHGAALHGRAEVVPILVNAGSRFDFTDYHGYTPLHKALEKDGDGENFTQTIAAMLDAGADPENPGPDGKTPLEMAKLDETKELIRSGINKKRFQNALKSEL